MSSKPVEENALQPPGEGNVPTHEGKEKEENRKEEMPLSECLEIVRQRVAAGKRLSTEIQPLYEFAKEYQNEVGKSEEQGSSIKITLPGSNYIGPGNPINAGEPKNTADKIALIHDWAYEFAETEQDVKEADLLAITLFEKEYKKSGNWQALVGDLGLRAKYFIEKKINQVLYPVLSSDSKEDGAGETKPPAEAAGDGAVPASSPPRGASGGGHHKPQGGADSEPLRPKREANNRTSKATLGIARALVTAAESTIKPILEPREKKISKQQD